MLLVFISFIFYLSLGIYTKIQFIFYPILLRACIKILATSVAITSALYSSRKVYFYYYSFKDIKFYMQIYKGWGECVYFS